MLVLMLAVSLVFADNAAAATKGVVYGTGDGLNVRSGPGQDYSIIDSLWDGDEVTILEETKGFYKISYQGKTGYASTAYIKVIENSEDKEYVYSEDFEEALEQENFPESYKEYLRKLYANHPNWVFRAQHTGVKWNDAVEKESAVSVNLVHQSADESWKSNEYGAIDKNGNHIVFDSGGWVAASKGIVQYYMDPRNFINEDGVFQFMTHSYDAYTQTKEGLNKLVKGTFLANKYPEKGYETYPDVLIYAGKESNANPNVLASMILVEQGNTGYGASISGKEKGYEGYYNFFNVRAYAYGGYSAVEYGLMYAKDQGWNSRTKSIVGGALHYATGYIKNNQNTLYLKKFNVMNGLKNVGTHQYMTNVAGAAQEASNLKKGYGSNDAITFYIPVYLNMPETACPQPVDGNNDYFLKSLVVEGYDLLPAFSMYTDSYEVVVPSDATSVNIKAVANNSASKINGTGKISLTGNVTEIKITVTASSGEKKLYTVSVAKHNNSTETISSEVYKIGNTITGVNFNTSVNDFKKNISVPTGYTIKVIDKNGKEITSGNISTGTKVVLYKSGSAVKTNTVVIKGDPSGDGKVTSVDVLYAKRHTVKTYELSGVYFDAADINGDGKITSVDPLYMQRHTVKTYEIKN